MALETFPFDAADYLVDSEMVAMFLEEAVEHGDAAEIAHAMQTVSRASGLSSDLREVCAHRPDLDGLIVVLHALGRRLIVAPAAA